MLHTFQILIENAIGKSKHLLKTENQTVPISAYDSFAALERLGKISEESLERWNATIGLRNKIVHDYMNIDMALIYDLMVKNQHHFVASFLCE